MFHVLYAEVKTAKGICYDTYTEWNKAE